jgi:hypothetical protein
MASFTLDDAKFAAVSALVQCLRESGSPRHPMDLEAVQRNEEWLCGTTSIYRGLLSR